MTEPSGIEAASFQPYRRKQIAELRPWKPSDDMTGISVSAEDARVGSPMLGDMIARNPKNHADQWLVATVYFVDNFEPADVHPAASGDLRERIAQYLRDRGFTADKEGLLLNCGTLDAIDYILASLPGLDEEAIRKDERERCAKVADTDDSPSHFAVAARVRIARRIRSLKTGSVK